MGLKFQCSYRFLHITMCDDCFSRYLCRTDNERIVLQNIEVVPFSLEGLDNTEVRVLSPLQASGLNMEITYEKFHQASHNLGDIMLQYISGEKPKGQLEIEKMLKVRIRLCRA